MRFEICGEEVFDIIKDCREKHFPELSGCNITAIFDAKKRLKDGKITLASIQKPNELMKFFTIEDSGSSEGYDYVIRIDSKCWHTVATPEEKIKIIRHELNHTNVDFDSNTPYKLCGHDIEDFVVEVERNADDPRWRDRIAESTCAEYDRE